MVEKDFGELLRRIDVEFESGEAVDGFFQLADFLERVRGDTLELDGIHANAGCFHARENGRERQINLLVKLQEPLIFHFGAENGSEAQKKIGAFAGRAGKRAIQMSQDDFGEFVIRGGGAQQKE